MISLRNIIINNDDKIVYFGSVSIFKDIILASTKNNSICCPQLLLTV